MFTYDLKPTDREEERYAGPPLQRVYALHPAVARLSAGDADKEEREDGAQGRGTGEDEQAFANGRRVEAETEQCRCQTQSRRTCSRLVSTAERSR